MILCYQINLSSYYYNIVLLCLFTLVEAYTIGVVTASYATRGQGLVVVQAGGLTLFIFLGLTLYTCTSKTDFSFMGPMLFIGVSSSSSSLILDSFFHDNSFLCIK